MLATALPVASESSAAVTVTLCSSDQLAVVKVRLAGFTDTSVPAVPPTVTVTSPAGTASSTTVYLAPASSPSSTVSANGFTATPRWTPLTAILML